MSKPGYEILYNQDSSALFFWRDGEGVDPEHVDGMVDEIADGGVDVLLICSNAQKTNYPSRVWETNWDDPRALADPKCGKYFARQKELAAQCDYLERALRRCRQRGLVPGVTVRMNDMHGVGDPVRFSRFYREHPEWRLEGYPERTWSAESLNYAVPQVREHYLALIRELVTEYDVAVLELDFLRFMAYFGRDNVRQNCETMTGLVARIRQLLDGTGRKIDLIPRVAATPGGALGLGFDVQAWAREGIVDGVTVGQYLNTGWEMPIDKFRRRVGPEVAIYACTDRCSHHFQGLPEEQLPVSKELARGFAAGYLAAGADGVTLFNFFCTRESRYAGHEPDFGALGEMRNLDELRAKPRRHAITSGFTHVESDLPNQVPVDIPAGRSRRFDMVLAAGGGALRASLRAVFAEPTGLARPSGQEDLWLYLNDQPVGSAAAVADGPKGEISSCIATFPLPGGLIRDGFNEIVLRSENAAVRVLGLEVCFELPGTPDR